MTDRKKVSVRNGNSGPAASQSHTPVAPTSCTICGEEIRKDDRGIWIDAETHINGEDGHHHFPESAHLLNTITAAVREADEQFQKSGGSSRHWVRDCFLPMLGKHGLSIQDSSECRYRPAWDEINKVFDDGAALLKLEPRSYLGWNWVHALVDALKHHQRHDEATVSATSEG